VIERLIFWQGREPFPPVFMSVLMDFFARKTSLKNAKKIDRQDLFIGTYWWFRPPETFNRLGKQRKVFADQKIDCDKAFFDNHGLLQKDDKRLVVLSLSRI
jgi:hypothetical protein